MAEQLLLGGLVALKEYIALHVLTCLVPAFLLAGAIVSFVSREAIIGYLGSDASKLKSFAIAGGGSSFCVSLLLHCYPRGQRHLLWRGWN
jgi:hypothetical protein